MSDHPTDDGPLRARLRTLREELADDGFSAALHRKLVAAGPPEPVGWTGRLTELFRRRPWLWPSLGAATGVAVFLLLGSVRTLEPTLPAQRPLPGIASAEVAVSEVPTTKVAIIKLNFAVDVEVASADLWVELPDGLVFWSEGEALADRSFAWTQALVVGDNVIPIAVRGTRPGQYRVTAVAQIGEQQVEHQVVLQVTQG